MTINIDELTVAQAREIVAMMGARQKAPKHHAIGKRVIVRSYGAGVFYATLAAKRGNEVDLTECRRIWGWKGANTLNEISLAGITPKGSRVSKPTAFHTVLDILEIIPCTAEAIAVLDAAEWRP